MNVRENIFNFTNSYCIRFVALIGYEIVVQALIEKRANVNAVDENGFSSLMYGVGEESIIGLLIENGANANAVNADNNTALIIAIKSGNHSEKFLMLIKCFGVQCIFNLRVRQCYEVACRKRSRYQCHFRKWYLKIDYLFHVLIALVHIPTFIFQS